MWRLTIVVLMLIAAVLSSDSPIYSAKYANVHYQPDRAGDNEESNKTATRDGDGNKTELNFRERHREEVTEPASWNPKYPGNKNLPEDFPEISTEPESEQINFARVQNRKIKSDKLQEDGVNAEEPYELTDLNEQGVYYIYHPGGVLQKVVYSTKDSINSMEYSTQVKYQNVEPIVEPIYTYDPSTFVLQRLQLINT